MKFNKAVLQTAKFVWKKIARVFAFQNVDISIVQIVLILLCKLLENALHVEAFFQRMIY